MWCHLDLRFCGALVDADEESTNSESGMLADRSSFWFDSDYFRVVGLMFEGIGLVVTSVLVAEA